MIGVRRWVAVWLAVTATALAAPVIASASAAAPANDTFAGATTIPSLPFSQTLDTSQATADPTDAQVATACGYPGVPVSASVWYAYTPSSDENVTVDLSGSTYGPVLGVVTGAPGAFRPVQCLSDNFVAQAGQTYYLDVASLGGSGGMLHLSVAGQPAPAFLDQSFTGLSNLSGLIDACCAYVGQTFTAGRSGDLLAVALDISQARTALPLRVAIRTVDTSGLPTSMVLGETLTSSDAPLTQLITFSQPIAVTAGTQYAIVVDYPGAPAPSGTGLAVWTGGAGDPYPGGSLVYSFDNGNRWLSDAGQGFDEHFQTFVKPQPTSPADCRGGGWRGYPQFRNQGDCVSFVVTGR